MSTFLGFILAAISIWIIVWWIDYYFNSHPLSEEEIFALSKKRQMNKDLERFSYYSEPSPADFLEKKAMKSAGEFVKCDIPYVAFPSRIAGFLKHKKHEWIVISFIHSFHVSLLWWNKGPDNTRVHSLLDEEVLDSMIQTLKPDTVATFHNHPGSYHHIPSEGDLQSATNFAANLSRLNINSLEFICVKGVPSLYYAKFSDSVTLLEPIMREIERLNQGGGGNRYHLRKELKRQSRAEEVYGDD